MLSPAYEPTSMEDSQTKALFLTPRKVETRTELRPGVAVSKEIGNCPSAKIAENAHWTPEPRRLQAAAVAECEEGVPPFNTSLGKYWSAWCADKSDTVCCVETWQVDLQVVVVCRSAGVTFGTKYDRMFSTNSSSCLMFVVNPPVPSHDIRSEAVEPNNLRCPKLYVNSTSHTFALTAP